MILGIDIGNTHITFGCIENNEVIKPILRIPTDRKDTEFGYAVKIKEILKLVNFDIKKIESSIISSVVPSVTEMMKRAVKIISDKDAIIVGPGIKTGIKIAIDDPGTVAADLIATAVGSANNYELPCAIVDMGTATTVTFINEKKEFKGGAIYPGVNTALNALTSKTSLLPGIEIKAPNKAIGSNTVECMKSGIIYGTAGAVDGILDSFEKEYWKIKSIICTGGVGHLLNGYFRHEIIMDEDLLLKGLAIISKKNNKEM